jgi:ATP-dependent Lon protease
MAAYKSNIKTVIIPKGNSGDMAEVDDAVKENIRFVYASKIDDVLKEALYREE